MVRIWIDLWAVVQLLTVYLLSGASWCVLAEACTAIIPHNLAFLVPDLLHGRLFDNIPIRERYLTSPQTVAATIAQM